MNSRFSKNYLQGNIVLEHVWLLVRFVSLRFPILIGSYQSQGELSAAVILTHTVEIAIQTLNLQLTIYKVI